MKSLRTCAFIDVMVITHVISSDIVMTAWGVQNVAVNTVVREKNEEEK